MPLSRELMGSGFSESSKVDLMLDLYEKLVEEVKMLNLRLLTIEADRRLDSMKSTAEGNDE